jgi:phage repressor protein C with HTH and peptisase S24 domain
MGLLDWRKGGLGIEARRNALALTRETLRERAHVSPGTLIKLINGDWETLPLGSIERVAAAVGMGPRDLLSDSPPDTSAQLATIAATVTETRDMLRAALASPDAILGPWRDDSAARSHSPAVPIFGSAAAGYGAQNEPVESWQDIERLIVPPNVAALPGLLFAMRVKGDSMQPLLSDGALIVVHNPAEDGVTRPAGGSGLQLITTEDYSDYVKLAVWDDRHKRVLLRSLNPAYPEQVLKYARLRYAANVVMIIAPVE